MISRMQIEVWEQEALIPAFDGHYLRAVNATVSNINTTLQLSVNLPDEVARDILARGGTRRIALDITEKSRGYILDAIHAGREAGEGPRVIARRIREHVSAGQFTRLEANRPGAGVRERANLIAREETRYSQRVSSLETYRHSGVFDAMLILDNQIGFNDADCSARDGTLVSFEEFERLIEIEHPRGTMDGAPAIRREE